MPLAVLGAFTHGKYDFSLRRSSSTDMSARRYEDPGRAATVLAQRSRHSNRSAMEVARFAAMRSIRSAKRLAPRSTEAVLATPDRRDEQQYTRTFDKLEIFVRLSNFAGSPTVGSVLGRIRPDGSIPIPHRRSERPPIAEIEESLSQEGDESHFATSAISSSTTVGRMSPGPRQVQAEAHVTVA